MRLPRRLLPAAFTIGAVVGSGLVGTLFTAPAASAANCDVAVVVDFSGLPSGPGTSRYGCAAQPSTGLDALDQAGFTPAVGASDQGTVVCDIDGAPGTNCADGGMWAYWYLPPGSQNWQALDPGSAGYRTPERGSAEGWSYQAHPDTPASPPAGGGTGTSDPTQPTEDPTPSGNPTTGPGPSNPTTLPPGQSSPAGGHTGVGDDPGAAPSDNEPAAPPPPGLGGPGGGGTGNGATSPVSPSAPSDPAGTSSTAESTSATDGLTSSGVLGIGGGAPAAPGGQHLSGPVAVAGFTRAEALTEASPWTLIACGAVLVLGSVGLAYLRHRRSSAETGGRHT